MVFTLLGLSMMIWLGDKALEHPEIQASQFGNQAPLWIPALLFVLVSTVAGVYVLIHAARRVDAGEDLFAQRHRKRPGAEKSPETPPEGDHEQA